jgi:hypothetical protein
VRLGLLFEQVGSDEEVGSVSFLAQDQYKTSLPIQRALDPDVIVAYEMNGVRLSEVLRLVVPGSNGNVWIAWLTNIWVSTGTVDLGTSSGSAQASASGFGSLYRILEQKPEKTVEAEPSAPKNETVVQPVAPLVNATQPSEESSQQLDNLPIDNSLETVELGFPAEIGYAVAFAIAVVVVTAGYLNHRRKHTSKSGIEPNVMIE